MSTPARSNLGPILFVIACLTLAMYFAFSAVQGDFGVLKRAEIDAEAETLRAELADLQARATLMENKTKRMSDDYLDLDLLDEQARNVLGLIRPDEIVIN